MCAVFDTNVYISTLVIRRRIALLEDDADNRILECARTARADVIVTGDKAMLALERFRPIRIVTLRAFLDELEGEPPAG